jgi:hypothetical protein
MTRRGDEFPQPTEVAPRQFTSRCEVRLAFAMLVDAVACLAERGDDGRFPPRLFRWEAEQWIESRDPGPMFSFENVCLILLLDPEDIRIRLCHWRTRRFRRSTRSSPASPRVGRRNLVEPARVRAGAVRPDWTGSRTEQGCAMGG